MFQTALVLPVKLSLVHSTRKSLAVLSHTSVAVFAERRVEEGNAATKCGTPVLSSADLHRFLVVPFTKAKASHAGLGSEPAGVLVGWSQGQMSPLGFS